MLQDSGAHSALFDKLSLSVRQALQQVWAVLPDARLVGGCVRDLLAGLALHDVDLATATPPEQVVDLLKAAEIKAVPTGLAHGTVTAVIARAPYEITTLRRDDETDGRHAVVSWTDDWREDAARRDFTINAMSLDHGGTVHDYFGGQADLAARRVRFVGVAADRIREDALRILRFFRFNARFGCSVPDPDALAAIQANAALIDGLSAERVASELLRILEGPQAQEAVALMIETGVLTRRLTVDALRIGRFQLLLGVQAPSDGILRLGGLSDDPDLGRALRLSGTQSARLAAMHGRSLRPSASDDDLRRARADLPLETWLDRSWLSQAEEVGRPDAAWDRLRQRLTMIERPVFPLAGRDVLKAGVPAGPRMGAILRHVEQWWREAGCRPDRAACLARLAEFLGQS